MTARLRQCEPGRSFARSASDGKAKQLSGFGERIPWNDLARLAGVQQLEARCSRVAFIVRVEPHDELCCTLGASAAGGGRMCPLC